jgi:hypothetical protein
MPIHRLLEGSAFTPEDIKVLISAFDEVCVDLRLAARDEESRQRVAKAVIGCAQRGIRDPAELRKCAHNAIMTT